MFLVFNSENLTNNLELFNRWNLSTLTIQENKDLFSNEFLLAWAQLPYRSGFRKRERWIVTPEGLIIPELLAEQNSEQETQRWAIPLKHINQPWIAFPLPPEWGQIPAHLQQEALNIIGNGIIEQDLDFSWWIPAEE